jgi:hypothetical protein
VKIINTAGLCFKSIFQAQNFMAIYMNSTRKNTMAQLTLFPEATRVNPVPCKVKCLGKQIIDTSGHNTYELLKKCSRFGLLTKMFQVRFLTEYWTERSVIWKLKATPAGRPYVYLHQPRAPYIKGKGFFWWPTPLAGDSNNSLLPGSQIKRTKGNFQGNPSLLLGLGLKPGTPLSVRFYEKLMGLPKNWLLLNGTAASMPEEMESVHT